MNCQLLTPKMVKKVITNLDLSKACERSTGKNYCPVNLHSVISKVFEKFVHNRVVDHTEKCRLFSGFQYGFWSSRSVVF